MSGGEIVALARGWIGTPYRHRASVRGAGADCLGLVLGVWRERFGAAPEAPPAYAAAWSAAGGELWQGLRRHMAECLAEAPLRPGQVILFRMRERAAPRHLGILAQAGAAASFVHAYSGHAVMENALSAPWRRRIAARFEFPQGGS